jgi:hypothetical protein
MLWLWSVIRWLLGLFILCIRGLAIDSALCYHEVHTASELLLCFISFLFVRSVGLWYKSKQLLPPFLHLRQTFFTYITFILIQ